LEGGRRNLEDCLYSHSRSGPKFLRMSTTDVKNQDKSLISVLTSAAWTVFSTIW